LVSLPPGAKIGATNQTDERFGRGDWGRQRAEQHQGLPWDCQTLENAGKMGTR